MDAKASHERTMFHASPDGVMPIDSHGQILMANPAMEALSGFPATELVGQNVDTILPTHLRESHAQSMRAHFTSPRQRRPP